MIKVFLLLRNNKQSGPFSLEELVQQNLRPKDLIWIDGRSSSWEFASELASLKRFLPQSDGNIIKENRDTHSAYLPKEDTGSNPENAAPPKIYVSLPDSAQLKKEKPASSREAQKTIPVAKPVVSPDAQSATEPKEKLVTKYISSLEEKEASYTEWIYKTKTKKSGLAPEWLGGIAILFLLIMGTAAYLVKNRGADKEQKEITAMDNRSTEELVTTVPVTPEPDNVTPVVSEAIPNEIPYQKPDLVPVKNQQHSTFEANRPVATPVKQLTAPVTTIKKVGVQRQSTAAAVAENDHAPVLLPAPTKGTRSEQVTEQVASLPKPVPAVVDSKKPKQSFSDKVDGFFNRVIGAKKVESPVPASGGSDNTPSNETRKATRRDDAEANSATGKQDLTAGMALTTIEPADNWMQGVHGLKMKVDNHNNFKITNASVEVRYFSDQHTVLEKKTIRLSDIPAGKSITMAIPDHRIADHAEASLISAAN